jgi:polyisoprenoid-binding protein YceI
MQCASRALLAFAVFLASSATLQAENICVMPNRGFFRVHTGTGGLFGVFGHDHLIEATKIEGCASVDARNLAQSSVKLTFAASELHVMDPKESVEERAKIEKTMQTEVLHISEHPKVTFESAGVMEESSGHYRVGGSLTILGKTVTVVIPVTVTRLDDGTYRVMGEYKFKQTTFGIQPIRLAGGTVRVKDEVRTEFDLFLK